MNTIPGFVNIGGGVTGDFYVPLSFNDRFRGADFLGAGGYGRVVAVRGKDASFQDLAVKYFLNPFDNPKRAQRCYRELQLLRELSHENIIKMRFAYTTDDSESELKHVYLASDYCGDNLLSLLGQETAEKHRFNLNFFLSITGQLLRALKYLNSANVIHRDLKPDNVAVVVTEEAGQPMRGKLTLLDFGIARVRAVNSQHTREPGTRYYRALETVSFNNEPEKEYNEKADMWSIGAMLCEMLTGRILFKFSGRGRREVDPIERAVQLCGPIPERVIMHQVRLDTEQEALRELSSNAERVDFLQHLQQEGRAWLQEEITAAGEQLRDFIDRTLIFDPNERLSVNDALEHPLFAGVRDRSKEVIAGHSVVDIGDQTLDGWRALTRALIKASPVRFDDPALP